MKHLVKLVVFLLVFLATNVVSADEWTYAGRFVLRADASYSTDTLILNHLVPFAGQKIGTGSGQYRIFDLYYHHNHDYDEYVPYQEYVKELFNIQGKIIPLNSDLKPLERSGLQYGTIVSDIDVVSAGTFSARSKQFRVFDRVTHDILFEAIPKKFGDELCKNSALEIILASTAPHPIPGVENGPKGRLFYKNR